MTATREYLKSRGIDAGDGPLDEFIEVTDEMREKLEGVTVGLGTRIASVLKPVARAIDGVLGTDLEHCGGCNQREEWLNEKFPG